MASPPFLNAELLRILEAELRAQGAPVVANWRPGLSEPQMNELLDPLPLRLTLEARRWWGWHDGVALPAEALAVERELGPERDFIPLAEALDGYQDLVSMALTEAEESSELLWHPHWMPVSRFGAIACDCSGPDDAPTPIRDVDYHHASRPGQIVARSFGEMVSWWIDALHIGAWQYDASRRRWDRYYGLIPPERQHTGLV